MLRRTGLIIFVVAGLILPTAQSLADESEDGAVDIMTAAVGEVLAMSDLCGWDFAAKVEELYQNGKSTLKLTAAQEKVIRAKVAAARRRYIRAPLGRRNRRRSCRCLQRRVSVHALREFLPGYLSTKPISFG